MLLAAIFNGVLRESLLSHYFPAQLALLTSGLLLLVLVAAIIYLTSAWFRAYQPPVYRVIGLLWVCLTLVFEYGFGFLVRGQGFVETSQVFNILSGNLFGLVVVLMLIGPLLVARPKG